MEFVNDAQRPAPRWCLPLLMPLLWQVWRNHASITEALLAAGAHPSAVDGESGWTPVHKALYLGHLGIARLLLK